MDTHISQAEKDHLKSIVKVLEEKEEKNIRYFYVMADRLQTLTKQYTGLNEMLREKHQKLLEKYQRFDKDELQSKKDEKIAALKNAKNR